jgi:hypothetical protein
MPLYKVFDSHIYHDGKPYGPGDTIELTEEEAGMLRVLPLPEGGQGKKGGKK